MLLGLGTSMDLIVLSFLRKELGKIYKQLSIGKKIGIFKTKSKFGNGTLNSTIIIEIHMGYQNLTVRLVTNIFVELLVLR